PHDPRAVAQQTIPRAGAEVTVIVCFPECYVPGYRAPGRNVPALDDAFLARAWAAGASAAAQARVAVVLGTERPVDGGVCATALVINRHGTRAGFQDKVQID